jgi:hypothetical protein
LHLPPDTFLTRLSRFQGEQRLLFATAEKLTAFQRCARATHLDLLSRQLNVERRMAALVEQAYALTDADRELLTSARVVRDPISVLEAQLSDAVIDGVLTGEPSSSTTNPSRPPTC